MAFLAAALSATIQEVAGAQNTPARATANDLDSLVPFDVTRRVAIGMTRDEVIVSMLGCPGDKLGNDLWFYWNFRAWGRPPDDTYTAVVVLFAADRVKLIRLTDASATKRLLLQFRGNLAQGRIMPTANRPEGEVAHLTMKADTPPR